jgi:hypothetical protein
MKRKPSPESVDAALAMLRDADKRATLAAGLLSFSEIMDLASDAAKAEGVAFVCVSELGGKVVLHAECFNPRGPLGDAIERLRRLPSAPYRASGGGDVETPWKP